MTPLVALLKEVGRFPKSLLVHALEQFGVLSFFGGGVVLFLSTLVSFCLPSKHSVGIVFLFLETLISHR